MNRVTSQTMTITVRKTHDAALLTRYIGGHNDRSGNNSNVGMTRSAPSHFVMHQATCVASTPSMRGRVGAALRAIRSGRQHDSLPIGGQMLQRRCRINAASG